MAPQRPPNGRRSSLDPRPLGDQSGVQGDGDGGGLGQGPGVDVRRPGGDTGEGSSVVEVRRIVSEGIVRRAQLVLFLHYYCNILE